MNRPPWSCLLEKEFRRHGSLTLAGLIFIAAVYLLFLIIGLADRSLGSPVHVSELLLAASGVGTGVACLMGGFFAGNAIAGERPAHTMEFIGYLPIPRRMDLLSRLSVAGALTLVLLLINAIMAGTSLALSGALPAETGAVVRGIIVTAVTVFGISWFLSAVLRSPGIAAIGGAIIVLVLVMAGTTHVAARPHGFFFVTARDYWSRVYPLSTGLIGIFALLGGSAYHLRRKVLS